METFCNCIFYFFLILRTKGRCSNNNRRIKMREKQINFYNLYFRLCQIIYSKPQILIFHMGICEKGMWRFATQHYFV